MQSLEEEASEASISEQLLMNTEQVGILLVSTLNTTNNETVKQINNQNIGMLIVYLYYIYEVFIVCTYICHIIKAQDWCMHPHIYHKAHTENLLAFWLVATYYD